MFGTLVAPLVAVGIVLSSLTFAVAPATTARAVNATSYIVTLRSANDAQLFRNRMMAGGGVVTEVLDSVFNGVIVDLTPMHVTQLRRDPRVLRIEANKVVRTSEVPPSWGLDRIDQRVLPLDSSFAVDPRWGQGVTAYIVDTGISLTHSDFSGRLLPGHDVITAGGNADDCNGHGTHVAGTVAGSTFGVARAARLVPVRVLDCLGGGTTAGVISGIDWVIEHHQAGVPAVLNMSLGGTHSVSLNAAVDRAVADGITVVVAAGNENSDACRRSPASASSAITVGSVTSADQRSSFSNFGACLDLFAPGSSITSAWVGGPASSNTISGTSMAAPHVAGVAAAYLSAWPTSAPTEVAGGLVAASTRGTITNVGPASPNGLLYVDSTWVPGAAPTPPNNPEPLPTAPPTAPPPTRPVVTPPPPTAPTVPITRPTIPPTTRPSPTTTLRPPNRPSTPDIDSVVAGNREVTVSASLTGYNRQNYATITFTSSPSGRTCTVSVTDSRNNSCTVTGLTNGAAYSFTAVAENAGGRSGTSRPSNSVVPFDENRTPGEPTNPAAAPDRFSRTTVRLTWSPPRDNGASIAEYRIEYRRNDRFGGTENRITSNSYELRLQTRGNVITFRVRACNARGSCSTWSDWSNPAIVGS
jgi:subtilisin family serine protease